MKKKIPAVYILLFSKSKLQTMIIYFYKISLIFLQTLVIKGKLVTRTSQFSHILL